MSTDSQTAAEESVADLIFGPEKAEEPVETPEITDGVVTDPDGKEYEPDPKPVEEGEETDPEEVPPVEAELVEFEWEGQLIEAPPTIKEALMRHSDYTQKTQTLSSERKSVEVQMGEVKLKEQQVAFVESVQPDLLKAQQLEAQADQAHTYLRDYIDSLTATDIEKVRLRIEDFRKERDDLVQSIGIKQTEFQQAQEQSHTELLNKGTEVLKQRIPNWGKEAQEKVREYALQSGYSEAEIQNVVDPRQVETLWKAAQYDALQEGKTAAVKKVQAAPSIKQKARNPMPKRTGEKLNLRKKLKSSKLSSADKADAVGQDLAKRFGM